MAEAEDTAPWTVMDLVFTVTVVIGSLFMAEIAALVLVTIRHGSSDIMNIMTGDARVIVPVQFAAYGIAIGFVFVTARVKYSQSLARALQWWPVSGKMVALFLVLGVVAAGLSQLVPVLFPSKDSFPIEKLFKDPQSGYLLAALGIGIAPFFEEMIFRGMLYPVMERHWGLEPAAIGSSLLFTAIHAPQLAGGLPQLGAIFLVGIALSYVRGRTKSLLPSFLMHTSYNATLFAAIFFSTDCFRHFTS